MIQSKFRKISDRSECEYVRVSFEHRSSVDLQLGPSSLDGLIREVPVASSNLVFIVRRREV